MRPELQERFLRVAHSLDRLDRLHNLVADAQQTSPRALIASAAVAGAEFLAAASGNSNDPGAIHRAYEEIFAAMEISPAVNEMLTGVRKAETGHTRAQAALTLLQTFRRNLSGGDSDE